MEYLILQIQITISILQYQLLTKMVFIITNPAGAYEIESVNDEVKRIFFEEGHFTESEYPFKIKPKISTLGIIIDISRQDPLISFLPDDSIGGLLLFDAITI